MHIHKPDDVLLMLGHACHAGRPTLTVTVGYVCEHDSTLLAEPQAWQWLMRLFPDEPFDLAEKKAGAGFGMAGDACAPQGSTVNGLTVRAGVGGLESQVLVQGDRWWTSSVTGWQASAAQPFDRMPIGLARAYGGPGWADNPYGRGHVAGEPSDGAPLPNVEHPGHPVLRPTDSPPVGTLGALPLCGSDRLRWLGTIDEAWVRTRLPWLPDDTDPRWFDRFPPSQCQAARWRGDEPWFAENMHPRHGRLEGRLPGLRPRLLMRTVAAAQRHAELQLDLDTVWLMPNDQRVVLLYRAQVEVEREDAKDILGLAVFTEHMSEPAQPLEHWSAVWRKAVGTEQEAAAAAIPLPAALGADELARLEAAREQAEAQAAEFEASLRQDIDKALQEGEAEGVSRLREVGYDVDGFKARAAQAETPDIRMTNPLGEMPAEPAAFRARLNAHIEEELKQAEAEARRCLQQKGYDVDRLKAYADAHSVPELSEREMIARSVAMLGLAPAASQAYLDEYDQFQKDMQALEPRLRAQFEEAEQAAAAALAATQAGRRKDADELPAGPRQPLSRDALLERAQRGEPAAWTQLEDLDLTGAGLAGLNLRRSVLRNCTLNRSALQGADLSEAQFDNCRFEGADLAGATLAGAQFTACVLSGAQLGSAVFTGARLEHCLFDGAALEASCWDDAQLIECSFEAAVLKGATGRRALFSQCRLPAVDAAQSRFEQTEFEQCVLEAARFSRASLAGSTLLACQAAYAHFDQAQLPGLRTLLDTRLDHANFNGADLHNASLQNTSLSGAMLREACLDRALVKECDLSRSDAWRMVAREADFNDSHIAQASWRGVNLMQATLGYAKVLDTDLTGSNLHAMQTRNATVQGLVLNGALMTRCRLLQEYGNG